MRYSKNRFFKAICSSIRVTHFFHQFLKEFTLFDDKNADIGPNSGKTENKAEISPKSKN